MIKLYRFMDLKSFLSIIETKKLCFVNPTCWDDTYEGYLLHMLDDNDNRRKLLEGLFNIVSPNNMEGAISNFINLWYTRICSYAQCWSTVPETDAMWRIYSNENIGIRVETCDEKIDKIISLFDSMSRYKKFCSHVEYKDNDFFVNEMSFENQLIDLRENKYLYRPYFLKREAFSHENEYRVILGDNVAMQCASDFSKKMILNQLGTKISKKDDDKLAPDKVMDYLIEIDLDAFLMNSREYKLKKNESKFRTAQDVLLIDINDLSQFIETVMVAPFTPSWVDDTINALCKRVGINYLGKSKLYTR